MSTTDLRKHVRILQSLAGYCRDGGEDRKYLEVLREIAAIEPNNEDVALETLEAYVRLEDLVGAIQYYKRFETALWNEMCIFPNEKLQGLYLSLRTGLPVTRPEEPERTGLEEVVLTGRSIGGIPYFLLVDLVAGALDQMEPGELLKQDERYIRDQVPIQVELALHYGTISSIVTMCTFVRIDHHTVGTMLPKLSEMLL